MDAGGSNTELLLRTLSVEASSEADEIHLQGPGANPKRIGMEKSARVLADLVHQALRRRPGVKLQSVCAGVAGADSEVRRKTLTTFLCQALGEGASSAHTHIVHDARIALEAAFGRESGIIVITGTGSAVFGRTEEGELGRTGGWGYILGDEGSGYALGRAGLRAVARAMDGGPPTLLQTLLPEKYGAESRASLIRAVYDAEPPLGGAAQTVLQAADEGDAVAARILEEQTSALARQVSWLADRDALIAPRVALFGGLTNGAGYVEALRRAVHGYLPDWSVQVASSPPVRGALHLALRRDAPEGSAEATCS